MGTTSRLEQLRKARGHSRERFLELISWLDLSIHWTQSARCSVQQHAYMIGSEFFSRTFVTQNNKRKFIRVSVWIIMIPIYTICAGPRLLHEAFATFCTSTSSRSVVLGVRCKHNSIKTLDDIIDLTRSLQLSMFKSLTQTSAINGILPER